MATRICWRCLVRAGTRPTDIGSVSSVKRVAPTAPFSTSSSLSANPPKAKGKTMQKHGNLKTKGNKQGFARGRSDTGRSHTPNRVVSRTEQKDKRKRIVLSNTNALAVNGLQDISADNMAKPASQAQVLGIPGSVVDQLRAVEAFKPNQGWGMFRRPAMLMRKETIDYAKQMDELERERKTVRRVVVGERLAGKTTMLLQAMTLAFIKGWVVVNLPKAQDIINPFTPYAPLSTTLPTTYTQPLYTSRLLSAIARANPVLHDMELSGKHSMQPSPSSGSPSLSESPYTSHLPSIPSNISLHRLCNIGASDEDAAAHIFTLLMQELLVEGRRPVLFCIDNLGFAMGMSGYRDAEFNPIHAHQLELLRWYMQHLSGAVKLPNGGMVLAATSGAGDTPKLETLEVCLRRIEEGDRFRGMSEYARYDERVLKVFERQGMQVQRLEGLSREEARGVMEYWAKSGMFPTKIDEERVGKEWVLSGGGNIGELERGCMRAAPALKA